MNDRLRRALSRIDQVEQSESAFSDATAFWVNGKEIATSKGTGPDEVRRSSSERG
jgi:hypothetical protein